MPAAKKKPAERKKAGCAADIMRPLALKLPEALELPHFGFPSFRVRGKIFATAQLDQHLGMVKLPVEVQHAMLVEHPQAFHLPAGAWARSGATLVWTDKVPRRLLGDLVVTAWAGVAPKALVAAFRK
ncbi:MAG: MmcQ/YjbR family DNA-binding protein [Hyphomonadaceae bacterium]|nr:MmcQ/YjbR family DNA-binding protein [Hyphomonadaceae bacterium]